MRSAVYEAARLALQSRDALCKIPGNRQALHDWAAGWHNKIHTLSLFFGGPGLTHEVDGGLKLLQRLREAALTLQSTPDLAIIAPNVPR